MSHWRFASLDSAQLPFPPTAYIGSEGRLGDDDSRHCVSGETTELTLDPPRPALGSRLFSSLSDKKRQSLLHVGAKSIAGLSSRQSLGWNIGDLFAGESAPIRLGLVSTSSSVTEDESPMPYKPSFTRRPASATVKTPPDTPTPRTSWFSRKPAPPPTVPRDEFINLDIDRALHHPNPTALAAFDDLMENATDLLRRMQKAYRIKAERLADMQPTMEAQREELAEANTRARYLEMRLKDAESRANEEARRADELCSKVEKLEAQICESEDSQSWGRRRETEASDSGFESDHDEKRTNDDTESHMTANSSQTLVLASRVALSPVHENMDDLRRKNLELTRRLEQMEQTFQGCIDFISATSRP